MKKGVSGFVFIIFLLISPCAAEFKWLQNDSFSGGDAHYQMGFAASEIMAASFDPDPSDYPFYVTKVLVLVGDGGSGGTTGNFVLHVWEDDGNNVNPGLERYLEAYQLTANNQYFNEITLTDPVLITDEKFRVGLEFTQDPPPSFSRDEDGLTKPSNNFIYTNEGEWYYSSTFGLQGDWILRAGIETSGVPTETPAPATETPTVTPVPPTETPVPTSTSIPPTWTPTQSPSPTVTPVPTWTATPVPTATATITATPVPTWTPTPTPPPTATSTGSPFPTSTPTPTGTETPSPTGTPTPTHTATATFSPTPTATSTRTPTPTFTETPTPTATPTITVTAVPSSTPTPNPTFTPYPTSTPYPTYTPFPTSPPTSTVPPTSTQVPSPTRTTTPTRTPTGTPPPTITPTPPPTPVPVPEVNLWMPSGYFRPGDPFALNAELVNAGEPIHDTRLLVALMVGDGVWFWPSWGQSLDSQLLDLKHGNSTVVIIPEFAWPENTGSLYPVYFVAGLLNSDYTEFIGMPDIVRFGFGD